MITLFPRLQQAARSGAQKYGAISVAVLLFILVLGLLYWRIIRGYTPPVTYAIWPEPPQWVQQIYAVRWLARAALVGAGLGLVGLEWAGGSVSQLLRNALTSNRGRVILIGLLTAIIGTFIFTPGNYSITDYRVTVSTPWVVLEVFKEGGGFVYWSPSVNMGSPIMQFHNSIYYYFNALVALVVADFFEAAEVSIYILFILSGYAMYRFARELTGSQLAGLVAAAAYCGSYYRFQLLSLSANFPIDALFFVFWPLQFYFIERACNNARTIDARSLSLAALTVGAQLWTHPLYGTWMAGFGCLYALVRIASNPALTFRERVVRLGGLAAAHAAAVVIGIYQILPLLAESSLVPASTRANGLGLQYILDVDLATRWGGSFIGNSILLFAGLGALLAVITRYPKANASIAVAAAAILLAVTPYYFPAINDILNAIPLGSIVYVRERYLYVAFGALAVLAGVFVSLLPRALERLSWAGGLRRWPLERMAILVIAIILLENVPQTLWFSYKSPDTYLNDSTGRWPIIATLAESEDKTTRVYDAGEGLSPSLLYPMLTGHPSLSGHYEDAPPSFATSRRFDALFTNDLLTGHISEATASLMYELNIGYIVTDGIETSLPELELLQRTDSATLWRVPDHAPITATGNPSSDNDITITTPQGGDVPVTVNSHSETATTTHLSFSLPQRAFVQLSYSAYPFQRVVLDGQAIEVVATPDGLIGFWVDAGSHTVDVLPELSPLRKVTLAVSGLATLIALAIVLMPRRAWRTH